MPSLSAKGSALLRRLTHRSSSNFKFAFFFLGPEQRDGLKCVYEFCRVVDDIVDERPPGPEGRAEACKGLDAWREELARIYGDEDPQMDLGRQIKRAVGRFSLSREGFEGVIDGCAMDLDIETYADMKELERYCYRVASCVGLLCIGIFGEQGPEAQAYARHLGLALQYTNILRDVGEDAARARIYLPQDVLKRHGVRPEDIFKSSYDRRFLGLAAEFADLAEAEYTAAWKIFPTIPNRRALLPAEVMGRTYHEVLQEIREHNFNVFAHRASLRRRDKLRVAAMAIARTNLPRGATHLSSSFSGTRKIG